VFNRLGLAVTVAAVGYVSAAAAAQGVPTPVPQVGEPVFSMGQPNRYQFHGALLAVGGAHVEGGGRALIGAHRSFFNPVAGALGVTGEAFFQQRGEMSGGLRLLATSRVIGLSAGLEQGVLGDDRGLGLAFSWQTAVRRGGIFRHGTQLRLDWMPRGEGYYGIGITMPIDQKFAGRTRERVTAIRVNHDPETVLPPPNLLDPAASVALTRAEQAAMQIAGFTNLYTPQAQRTILTSLTRDYPAVLASYHANITQAFAITTGDTALGRRLANDGRDIILDAVVVPFNSSFGQAKKGSGIGGLTTAAQRRFDTSIVDSLELSDERKLRTKAVFTRWLHMIEEIQFDLVRQWRDSRMIWLPMQLGLTADEFDDQAEVDDLIARVVGHSFSDQNGLAYLSSSELPLEIARTIFATRDYHVLWTHDFAGRRFSGAIDNIGYSMVADVYLPALTEAVKRYDSTGVMPLYMIMLDEYFYEPNDGRLWMTILEDPLNADMSVVEDPERVQHLEQRQRELRAAVEKSPRLQAEKRRGIDPKYVVKVHVNITFPADFSYRSKRIIPPIPFAPDNLMRDHRKIVFYDINESDPYRGALILMGVGIGEHYASPTWEDRGYRIRGPAALEARRRLRRTLTRNGIPDDKIPLPLRATTTTNADQQQNQPDYIGRALQVQNVPGFGPKESSVARAAMYNLASPGCTIIVPDPLWLSETWAGMLAAAAARGSKVMIIAPSVANAPSPQAPLMALSHEVLSRLLVLQRGLAAQRSPNDGELRIGLFAAKAQVDDPVGRAREIREGIQRAPWIRSIIPFDSATLAVLEHVTTTTAGTTPNASTRLARDEKPRDPQLHQKTQLIALPGAMSTLLRLPGWPQALAQSITSQQQQTAKFTEQLSYTTPEVDTAAMRANDALLTSFEQGRPEDERQRVSFYFSVGTQNMDDRGLASDGEASVIVSGYHAAAGVVDLYNVMARSRWITTEAELDQYIPPPSGFMKRLVRWLRGTL
jgi:hypothetical protein